MDCPKCNGTGYKVKTNFLQATREKKSCEECKGTGKKEVHVATGARVGIYGGELYSFQYLEDNEVVSELRLFVSPIIDKDTGKIMLLMGKTPMIKGEILRLGMQTKPKFRKRGLMGHLLGFAQADIKMRIITCEWDYCTIYARNFLLSHDFKQEDGYLVWENLKRS